MGLASSERARKDRASYSRQALGTARAKGRARLVDAAKNIFVKRRWNGEVQLPEAMSDALDGIFHEVTELPNPNLRRLFDRLVGLDEVKERLLKEARILLKPKVLEEWSRKHYSRRIALLEIFADRPSLFIFGG